MIATRDYCFAPSMEAICQAVDFIHSKCTFFNSRWYFVAIGKNLMVIGSRVHLISNSVFFFSLKEMLRLGRRLMSTARRVGAAAQLLSYATWFVSQFVPKQVDQRHHRFSLSL